MTPWTPRASLRGSGGAQRRLVVGRAIAALAIAGIAEWEGRTLENERPHLPQGMTSSMTAATGKDTAKSLSRRRFLQVAGAMAVAVPLGALAGCSKPSSVAGPRTSATGADDDAVLYRQVGCACCATYADYLRENGFTVRMETVDDLAPVREDNAIPEDAVGCHTTLIDGYVIEGHVPAEAITRLLSEGSKLDGISVVGMPGNSPGMGEPNGQPLAIKSFKDGQVSDYMSVTTF